METGTQLDPRVVTLWRRYGTVATGAAVLAAIAGVVLVWLNDGPLALVAALEMLVIVAVGLVGFVLPGKRYERWSYSLGPVALELRHGALIRRHSVIPYFRVQHVDTSRGPLERNLGLFRLKVHTASSGTDATIPGLDEASSTALREAIAARAGSVDGV